MKNKISKSYKSLLNKQETHKLVSFFEFSLKQKLINKFDLLEIKSPLFSSETESSEWFELYKSRQITFDSSFDNNIYFLFNNFEFFLRNKLLSLEIDNNFGLLINPRYILRDQEINNIQSIEKNEIQIEIRYDRADIDNKLKSIAKDISAIIKNAQSELIKQNKKLSFTKFIKDDSFIDTEDLLKRKPSVKVENFIEDYSNDDQILISRINHKNTDNAYLEYRISFFSEEIKETITPIQIINRSSLKETTISENAFIDETSFSIYKLKDNLTKSINIKIDIDKLLMILLKKQHIIELQNNNFSSELKEDLNLKKHKLV